MKFCKLIILTENLTIMENVINLRFFFQVIAACSTTLFANLCYAMVSSEDLNGTFTNYVTQLGEGFITFYTTAVHGSTVINKFCLWFYSLLLFFVSLVTTDIYFSLDLCVTDLILHSNGGDTSILQMFSFNKN